MSVQSGKHRGVELVDRDAVAGACPGQGADAPGGADAPADCCGSNAARTSAAFASSTTPSRPPPCSAARVRSSPTMPNLRRLQPHLDLRVPSPDHHPRNDDADEYGSHHVGDSLRVPIGHDRAVRGHQELTSGKGVQNRSPRRRRPASAGCSSPAPRASARAPRQRPRRTRIRRDESRGWLQDLVLERG
jgi:hypothetical protein